MQLEAGYNSMNRLYELHVTSVFTATCPANDIHGCHMNHVTIEMDMHRLQWYSHHATFLDPTCKRVVGALMVFMTYHMPSNAHYWQQYNVYLYVGQQKCEEFKKGVLLSYYSGASGERTLWG